MACKFCGSALNSIDAICKDRPDIAALKCSSCSLVQLGDFDHINDDLYAGEDYLSDDYDVRYERESYWNVRRIEKCSELLPDAKNRKILDFGCGIGGFLKRANGLLNVTGFDLSERLVARHKSDGLRCVSDVDDVPKDVDTIVLFHVLEHIKKPWEFLAELAERFPRVDRFVIEVPHTDEILISKFNDPAYRQNHFVSLHLYYFAKETLRKVVERAGLSVHSETQLQRYSLGNTMGWLRDGKGGGQDRYPMFNDYDSHRSYEASLEKAGVADSLFFVVGRLAAG